MQSRLLYTVVLAAAAAWLLSERAAPVLENALGAALLWTGERVPQLPLPSGVPELDLATSVLAILLLLLVPVLWLKPT